MTVHHMAIKLGHDKGQRANIYKVTSLLATDYMYIEYLIDVATGIDLRKLKCKPQVNHLSIMNFGKMKIVINHKILY